MKSGKILTGKFGFMVLSGCAVVFMLLLFIPQSSHTQTVVDRQRQKELEDNVKKQREMFYKVSSSQNPVDEGNRIVAVRRIKLRYEDIDGKGFNFTNQKNLIEIELFSKVDVPVTNAQQFLVIGDRVFTNTRFSADMHTIFVHLTPEEFNEIRNGAIISFAVTAGRLDSDMLKDSYKNGESNEIPGAKFGRLVKASIEHLRSLEEDEKMQLMRIVNTKNSVQ